MNNYDIISSLDVLTVVEELREEVRQHSDFLAKTKRAGNNIMVTCPYHESEHTGGQERNASMGITLEDNDKSRKGTCHCFTCNATVDLLELVGYVNGVDDDGAYGRKWVYRNYLVFDDTQERKPIQIWKNVQKEPEPIITEEEISTYAKQIPKYVLDRGIDINIAAYFRVGYDSTRDAAVFPVFDKDGTCRFIQKRMINYKYFENTEYADKSTLLYGLDKVYEILNTPNVPFNKNELYVVESIIDALYLWSYGKLAVATLQAFPTKEQIQLLKEVPIEVIVSAQDNDEAGTKGSIQMRNKLKTKIIKRIVFPRGCKDVNDMSKTQMLNINKTIVF